MTPDAKTPFVLLSLKNVGDKFENALDLRKECDWAREEVLELIPLVRRGERDPLELEEAEDYAAWACEEWVDPTQDCIEEAQGNPGSDFVIKNVTEGFWKLGTR